MTFEIKPRLETERDVLFLNEATSEAVYRGIYARYQDAYYTELISESVASTVTTTTGHTPLGELVKDVRTPIERELLLHSVNLGISDARSQRLLSFEQFLDLLDCSYGARLEEMNSHIALGIVLDGENSEMTEKPYFLNGSKTVKIADLKKYKEATLSFLFDTEEEEDVDFTPDPEHAPDVEEVEEEEEEVVTEEDEEEPATEAAAVAAVVVEPDFGDGDSAE